MKPRSKPRKSTKAHSQASNRLKEVGEALKTAPPKWLYHALEDAIALRLAGGVGRLRWLPQRAELQGEINKAPICFDLDQPCHLKLSRSKRRYRRLWGLSQGEEALLHVGLRVGEREIDLQGVVADGAELDGLPWFKGAGYECSGRQLKRLAAALHNAPELHLASWDQADLIDPAERQAEADETPSAPEKAAPKAAKKPIKQPLLTGAGVTLTVLGIAGTTLLTTIWDRPSWYTGFGFGFVVAAMSMITAAPSGGDFEASESMGRYGVRGFGILPVYGLLLSLAIPALRLTDPDPEDLWDSEGYFTGAEVRFQDAKILSEYTRRCDSVVAPLVPASWEPGDPVSLWAVCRGSDEEIAACVEAWDAPPGTLFEGEVFDTASDEGCASASAKELLGGQLLRGEAFVFYTLEPSPLGKAGVWVLRFVFACVVLGLVYLWLLWGRPPPKAAAQTPAAQESKKKKKKKKQQP